MDMRKRIERFSIALTAVVLIFIGYSLNAGHDEKLEVDVLDVGQGDAILIQTPYGQNILIDGGPDKTVLTRLGEELPFYDRRIDMLILTHPHADHVNGLVDVLERYEIGRVLYTGALHTSAAYLEFLNRINEKNIPLELIEGPRDISFGDEVALHIFYPRNSFLHEKVEELNNTSIVGKLVYKDTSFLLMGDAEQEVEQELLRAHADVDADVLKVGHHGSYSSSTPAFLDAVTPDYAAISVGADNRYGHPHEVTIKKLLERGMSVFRTDWDGTIEFISDGKKITPPQ